MTSKEKACYLEQVGNSIAEILRGVSWISTHDTMVDDVDCVVFVLDNCTWCKQLSARNEARLRDFGCKFGERACAQAPELRYQLVGVPRYLIDHLTMFDFVGGAE